MLEHFMREIRNQQVVSSSLTVGSFVIKGLHDLMNHKKCLGLPMGYLMISISRYTDRDFLLS